VTTYRAGQRVRVEIDGEVLEVFDGYALKVRADVDGDAWYFKAPALGCTVTILSEPRPGEPQGLGAVVQASLADKGKSWLFVRVYSDDDSGDYKWKVVDPSAVLGRSFFKWDRFIDPVIKAEGWTP
jgi:hypothetical protein